MGFMRRKSVAAADEEVVKPRNRLSKPMTIRSSSSSQKSSPGSKSPPSRSNTGSISSRMALEELESTPSQRELRDPMKPYILETTTEIKPRSPTKEVQKKSGVASLVTQFENAASISQQSFPGSPLSSRPLSSGYGSHRLSGVQQQMQDILDQDQMKMHSRTNSTLSSTASSLEKMVDPYAIPRRRESTYRPGEQTRKLGVEDKENQPPNPEERIKADNNKPLPSISQQPKSARTQHPWSQTPEIPRVETPASLEHRAIGNFQLGSLRIVNGRSSPVPSELSKPVISKQLRDVSSEYADSIYSKDLGSEGWEDDHIHEEANEPESESQLELEASRTPTCTTPEPQAQQVSMPMIQPHTPLRALSTYSATPMQSPDRTSIMAQSYICELQNSPFSLGTVSPISTKSIIHHHVQPDERPLTANAQQEEDMVSNVSIDSEQPSVMSKPSVTGTASTRDQMFSSALEYQAPNWHVPPSPARGISPESLHSNFVGRSFAKVDSGYGSGNSMLSFSDGEKMVGANRKPPKIDTTPTQEVRMVKEESSVVVASPKKESSPRKFGRFFPLRPAMQKSPATDSATPKIETAQSQPSAVANTHIVAAKTDKPAKPMTSKEDPALKAQKKLLKSRPLSRVRQSQEIVVQRLASCESTLELPAITDVAKANLKRRSLQVPELDKTFSSQSQIRNQPSTSSLALPLGEIRFPSPLSDQEGDDRRGRRSRSRSKSRPRSKSRRRSFLEIFRSNKDDRQRELTPVKRDNEVSITDFGDVVASLGANPYDIAHSRPRTSAQSAREPEGQWTNPHDISVNRPHKRLSMNDEEASEYARRRSYSFSHGDKYHDHGGFLGRGPRVPMTDEDVPPMPPMPNEKELKRISQRQSLQSQYIPSPNDRQRYWTESPSSGRQPESSPAHPPPSHSPAPIHREYQDEHAENDDFEYAPPPPSHSPIPMNISSQQLPTHSSRPRCIEAERNPESNAWDTPSRAWRERRKSASEALESHRRSLDLRDDGHQYRSSAVFDDYDDSAYMGMPSSDTRRHDPSYQEEGHWLAGDRYYDDFENQSQPKRGYTLNDGVDNLQHPDYLPDHHSHPDLQFRHRRHHTWDDGQGYGHDSSSYHFSQEQDRGSQHWNDGSMASTDSRQSFYSHNNCHIDRPFDPPPRMSHEYDDDYGQHHSYSSPQHSSARGRGQHREEYDYSQPNGYEREWHQPPHKEYPPNSYYQHSGNRGHVQQSPIHRKPLPQYHKFVTQSRSPQPSPLRSEHHSHTSASPVVSRPSSRHSTRFNASPISLTEGMHPRESQQTFQPPDFDRYSGGMEYGYEGRDTGFGGSAGTRGGSGRANAMFKGTELRGSHGVDLGDVPIIGVTRRMPRA